MNRDEARQAITVACGTLARAGLLVGTAGNVAVALDGADAGLIAVTATGVVLADATPQDVTVVDRDGTVVDGALAPTSEIDLHLQALAARPDATAVVHTHSPVATALSLVEDEIACVHYQQLALGGAIPVVPFAVFGTPELASSVRAALATKNAALLANHGTVTIGHDLAGALENARLLEWICTLYWQARTIGVPRALSTADQQAVIDHAISTGYGKPREAS